MSFAEKGWTTITWETIKQELESEMQLQGKSAESIKMYLYFNKEFFEFVQKDPAHTSEKDVKTYLGLLLSEKKYKAASVQLAKSALKFHYDDMLKLNIVTNVKVPKNRRPLPQIPSKNEVRALIDAADSNKHKLMITLMYSSGLRAAECASLRFSDLDLEEKTGLLREGKGGKDRFFILAQSATELLKETFDTTALQSNKYVFEGARGQAISTRALLRAVHIAAKRAGIQKRMYCHLLRHAFATHLLEQDVDIRTIQELLAHSNLQTTQFYTQISKKRLQAIKSPLDTE